MNSEKKINYIFSIVTYHAPDYFRRCIEHLEWVKKHPDIAIIVVDNSEDDSISKIIPTINLNIGYYKSPSNIGFGSAHNKAFEICAKLDPQFFIILNPDLIFDEEDFEHFKHLANDHPNSAIIGPLIVDENGQPEKSVFTDPPGFMYLLEFTKQLLFSTKESHLGMKTEKEVSAVKGLTGACMMMRCSLIEKPEIFDPEYHMYFEDLDLCTRTRKNGWSILYTPNTRVVHSRGKSSEELPNVKQWRTEMMYRSAHLYFRKNKSEIDQKFLNFSLKTALKLRIKLNKDRELAQKLMDELFPKVQ